jgi:hypothetical protein
MLRNWEQLKSDIDIDCNLLCMWLLITVYISTIIATWYMSRQLSFAKQEVKTKELTVEYLVTVIKDRHYKSIGIEKELKIYKTARQCEDNMIVSRLEHDNAQLSKQLYEIENEKVALLKNIPNNDVILAVNDILKMDKRSTCKIDKLVRLFRDTGLYKLVDTGSNVRTDMSSTEILQTL